MSDIPFGEFYQAEKNHRDKMRANLYDEPFGSPIEGPLPKLAGEIGIHVYFGAALAARRIKMVIENFRKKHLPDIDDRTPRNAFLD
jgi:hypothetical protein